MYDIVCVGNCSCDMIFPNLTAFPQLGKEVCSTDFFMKPGGAANTPVALSILGAKTVFASQIGDDLLGNILFDTLVRTGLDCSALIQAKGKRTSVSASLSMTNDRGFATYFAEMDRNIVTPLIRTYAAQATHVHAFLDDMLAYPILDIVLENGNTLSIDTGWNEHVRLKDIEPFLKYCAIFFTNEVEGAFLTGLEDPKEILYRLGEYCNTVVVKLGGNGSMIKHGDVFYEIPALDVAVKDTTGAGDLYVAGFLYGFLNHYSMEDCGRLGTASGAVAVTFYGGVDDAYTKERVFGNFTKKDLNSHP